MPQHPLKVRLHLRLTELRNNGYVIGKAICYRTLMQAFLPLTYEVP